VADVDPERLLEPIPDLQAGEREFNVHRRRELGADAARRALCTLVTECAFS
jgi:hypothetical protein